MMAMMDKLKGEPTEMSRQCFCLFISILPILEGMFFAGATV